MDISIIIPVFNNWKMTEACLRSIAKYTPMDNCEIILVDNASTDETCEAAVPLGAMLFGTHFTYLRNSVNHNFSGACNQGAYAAQSAFLFFLNNDTLVTDNWLSPLLAAFVRHPNLGGCGPLLLYPKLYGRKDRVQHAGVFINTLRSLGHLYRGFPATHPLVLKERQCQVITGAALLIPKQVFQLAGGFDTNFKNGFEDVDLCLTLGNMGYTFMVQPQSVIYHLESQTSGRFSQSKMNSAYLTKKSGHLIRPDSHLLAAQDGLLFTLSPWLTFSMQHKPEQLRNLNRLNTTHPETLEHLLDEYPLWAEGYQRLATLYEKTEKPNKALHTYLMSSLFSWDPVTTLNHILLLQKTKNPLPAATMRQNILEHLYTEEQYLIILQFLLKCTASKEFGALHEQCQTYLNTSSAFFKKTMNPYLCLLKQKGLLKHPMQKSEAI